MADREKVIDAFERCFCEEHEYCPGCYQDGPGFGVACRNALCMDVLTLLKEQENLLGIRQTADNITFISTGTAQDGEARGALFGKLIMHEWLKKELLYRGLLTDDIRVVFDLAEREVK